MSSMEERFEAEVRGMGKWWWLFLITGAIWIILGISVLNVDTDSVRTVGVVVGAILIASGIEDFLTAGAAQGAAKWLMIGFGVLLTIGGLVALFNPVKTTVALADMLGFLFAMVGILWILEAFLTKAYNDAWWLGLITGGLMVVLGFMSSGQLLVEKLFTLIIFVGMWMLMKGIVDIVRAFQVKKLRKFDIDLGQPAAA